MALGALAIVVEEEAVACSAGMTGAKLADIFKVNTAIWHLLAQRGLVDVFDVGQEMPPRLRARIDTLIELNMKEASEVAGQLGSQVVGLIGFGGCSGDRLRQLDFAVWRPLLDVGQIVLQIRCNWRNVDRRYAITV